MSFIGWLIFGGVVGWIASKITKTRQSILRNVVIGLVGALLGGWLWSFFVVDPEPYSFWDLGSWATAILGASLLLYAIERVAPR
jgi:uncharacterized membrane protein YeaQ/YmgE (transglycosylase-associated protein family)